MTATIKDFSDCPSRSETSERNRRPLASVPSPLRITIRSRSQPTKNNPQVKAHKMPVPILPVAVPRDLVEICDSLWICS